MAVSFVPIEQCQATQPFAECRGVDLSGDLTDEEIVQVKRGLLKHGLLLFRNQKRLTPKREVIFNKAFGWHDPGQSQYLFGFGAPNSEDRYSGGAQIPEWPQVSLLGNVRLRDYYGLHDIRLRPVLGLTFSGWHSDGLHDMLDGLPELTTMFNPMGWKTISGGETFFTSGVNAIDRLDEGFVDELSRCMVAYLRSPNDDDPDECRRVQAGTPFMVEEGTRRIGFCSDAQDPDSDLNGFQFTLQHAEGGGRHPCIYSHPVTGQRSLYVSPAKAIYLLDIHTGLLRHDIQRTTELLSMALLPSVGKSVRYAHKWCEGDFVAWLNTLVLHSASDSHNVVGDRLLHRVRLSTPKK